MTDDHDFERAKQKAFRLLALRARSEKELRAKLKEKKFDNEIIDRVVFRLQELNYLDDETFARQWVRHLAVDKLSGNRKIESSLREKGISKALSERMIAEIREDFPERQAVRKSIYKKLRGEKHRELDVKEKRRLAQHLMAKGFTPGIIFETIAGSEEEEIDADRQ